MMERVINAPVASDAGLLMRPRLMARPSSFWMNPATLALFAALLFNFGLCFVNTSVGGVGTGAAIACEILIIFAVLLYVFPTLSYDRFVTIGAAVLFLIAISAVRMAMGGTLDIKPVRDLLIPIAFFLLGAYAADLRQADRIVTIAVAIVIAVGAFEYFFPDIFTRIFNVAGFYMERGTMSVTQSQQSSSLFVSGMRPEGATGGRGLFPFLGNHRVSSIFLEPISAGNFGIVVCAWALVRSFMQGKVQWLLFVSAGAIVVMADSRFGANFCLFAILLAALPDRVRTAVVATLPALMLLALVFLPGPLSAHYGIDNGFIGRIILSGHILDMFDVWQWIGIKQVGFFTSDSGYSYALSGFGIIGLALFWAMLMLLRGESPAFYLLRDIAAAYFAVLLCISNSPFTIKTGALLWFLVGVLSRLRRVEARVVSRPAYAPAA